MFICVLIYAMPMVPPTMLGVLQYSLWPKPVHSRMTCLQSLACCLTQQLEQMVDAGRSNCDWLQQVVLTPDHAAGVPAAIVLQHAAMLPALEPAAVQPLVLMPVVLVLQHAAVLLVFELGAVQPVVLMAKRAKFPTVSSTPSPPALQLLPFSHIRFLCPHQQGHRCLN